MPLKLREHHVRLTNALFGLGVIGLAITVLMLTMIDIPILVLILILSIALFISGLVRIINASSIEIIGNEVATYKAMTGLLAMLISVIIFFSTLTQPQEAVALLILVFAFALILTGIVRFSVGYTTKGYPKGFRIFLMIIGGITITISIIIFMLQLALVDNLILIFLLSISLIINGLAKLILAIVGITPTE